MRISDWSSDVCSSDLLHVVMALAEHALGRLAHHGEGFGQQVVELGAVCNALLEFGRLGLQLRVGDRKSVVSGKSVSVRVDLGGRRIIKKKNTNHLMYVSNNN